MAKRASVSADLEKLKVLAETEESAERTAKLRRYLGNASNLVVEKAVRLVLEWGARELAPDVEKAFDRFLKNGAKTDPNCAAKLAIVETLTEFEANAEELYLRGIHYVQMEPVFARKLVDTAGGIRGACARALARLNYPDIHLELTTLITDKEVEARREAVSVLTWLATPEAEVMLRMKALMGDEEPDVTGLCLAGLMKFAPEKSLEFVAGYLKNPAEELFEAASLALGESKGCEALGVLLKVWERELLEAVRVKLMLPLALTRSDAAFDLLLDQLKQARPGPASAALRALALYGSDPSRRGVIETILKDREIPALWEVFEEEFEPISAN